MKRINKSAMMCIMLVHLCPCVHADPLPDGGPYTETVDGITWHFMIIGGSASVGQNSYWNPAVSQSTKGKIEVPSILGGCQVTDINSHAFRSCNAITSIEIPEGVTNIGSSAMCECTALGGIALPSTLRTIGSWAFANSALYVITIPSGVETLSSRVMSGCLNLQNVYLPSTIRVIKKNALTGTVNGRRIYFYGDAPSVEDALESGSDETIDADIVYVSVYSSGWGAVPGLWRGINTDYIEKVDMVNYTASQGVEFSRSGNIVTLHCATTNAVIHYTTNGLDVATTSPVYLSPIIISETTTLKARAYLEDKAMSELLHVEFIRTWKKVADIRVNATAETFNATSQEVTLSCETEDATIYYTIDGSEPSATNGRVYKGPFDIYQTTTVKAIAVKDDWQDSAVASATFTKENEIGPAINMLEVLPDNDKTHPWMVVSDVTHDGVSAVKSGEIEDDESTTLKVTVYGAGQLSFWWKTSCEPSIDGEYYDYATFCNGSTAITNLAGVTDWQQVWLDVPGTGKHTFKWTYQKDDSNSTVPDGMWLDQVQWMPATIDYYSDHTLTTETPVKYNWLRKYGLGVTTDFESAAKAKSGKYDGAGRELTVEDDYIAGTDPTNMTSHLTSSIEMVDGLPVITWKPDLNESGTKVEREYKIWGSTNLVNGGDWEWPTNALHRFFKVTVEMP